MRTLVLAAAATLAASAARATPASVDVQLSPALQGKAERSLGVRDVDRLARELRGEVTKRLARTGAYDGARIELVLADAEPNRPTYQQLGAEPGLSERSHGIGGAEIEGRVITADGRVTPVRYRYYSPTLALASHAGIWTDAEWAFQRFAYELGRGSAPR